MKLPNPIPEAVDGERDRAGVIIEPGSLEDLEAIVELHLRTFSASQHLGVWFGTSYLKRMYESAIRESTFVFLKATRAGRLVGFTSARVAGYHSLGIRLLDARAVVHALLNIGMVLNPSTIKRLLARLSTERELRRIRLKPFAQLFITCVAEECRNLGIGSRLRRRMYADCLSLGVRYLYTGILTGNVNMLAITRRDGFREVFRDRFGVVVHLEKYLGPAEGGETVPEESEQVHSRKLSI